eukprot:c18515_g1_i2.p1 GENE.c18515_g1_i2~~c18515_g1_i2.p1  ORF type:complete len:200 (+),score=82.96 c18515_g1_i2:73-600(+)
MGGSGKLCYIEGWIEFKDKRIGQRVARMLNNQEMTDKKHSFYFGNLWNLKYLKGFKWHNLQEKMRMKTIARKQRLNAEMAQAQKEANFFLARVEQARRISQKEKKKQEKALERQSQNPTTTSSSSSSAAAANTTETTKVNRPEKIIRRFKQRKVVADPTSEQASSMSDDILKSIL